jgi:hypothetical protein
MKTKEVVNLVGEVLQADEKITVTNDETGLNITVDGVKYKVNVVRSRKEKSAADEAVVANDTVAESTDAAN